MSEKGERALVLTLTKRSSEDLADYLRELKFKVRYIHSELNTFERTERPGASSLAGTGQSGLSAPPGSSGQPALQLPPLVLLSAAS